MENTNGGCLSKAFQYADIVAGRGRVEQAKIVQVGRGPVVCGQQLQRLHSQYGQVVLADHCTQECVCV